MLVLPLYSQERRGCGSYKTPQAALQEFCWSSCTDSLYLKSEDEVLLCSPQGLDHDSRTMEESHLKLYYNQFNPSLALEEERGPDQRRRSWMGSQRVGALVITF